MSDGLTTTPTARESLDVPAPARARRPAWFVAGLQALVTVTVLAGVGALCGLLWFRLWDVPQGVVADHQWYTGEAGLRDDFAGTGWYVAIATVAGLLLGALTAWLFDRAELVTLLAVTLGGALAAWLMLEVGYQLSPPDPEKLALTAADGTELDGALRVHGWPPKLAFPFGSLVGLSLVYFLTTRRGPRDPGSADGTRG